MIPDDSARSTRMYPSDPTQKQVLVVRPRGGRSGKNWRIFVRPREVVVKIIISPKATGRRWNGVFHPRPDGKGASRREVWFGNNRLPSVFTKPNSFVFKSTSWQELHFSLAIIPDKVLDHNEPQQCSSECLNYSYWNFKSILIESFAMLVGSSKRVKKMSALKSFYRDPDHWVK